MVKTIIQIKENEEGVEKVCSGIANIDDTFVFEIKKRKYGTFLEIESDTEDKAHKRGMLLTKKYLPKIDLKDLKYKVKNDWKWE